VLRGARGAFAEHGFDGATVRDIAARAGVDPALVIQFFTNKEGVFAAAMELPFDAAAVVSAALQGDPAQLGARLVRSFVALWDDPEVGARTVALLRSASTHARAARALRELIDTRILAPIAAALHSPDATLRANLVSSQMVGLGFARYVLGLEPLASASPVEIEAYLAPTVQRYLTEPL
jgi:AcrR family transcriptional regulator